MKISYGRLLADEINSTDYGKVIRIITGVGDQAVTLVVHQYLIDVLSTILMAFSTPTTEGAQLAPDCFSHAVEPQTWHHFVHWIYFNDFTLQEDIEHFGYQQLLNLYFLAEEYEIAVLRNVVIDRLMEESSHSPVPVGMSKIIYAHTPTDPDALKRLWVDFYIWNMEQEKFEAELKAGELDQRFIKDVVTAQMRLLRRDETISSEPPPYQRDPTAYHMPDYRTGTCCCRSQFEGTEYMHRSDYYKEKMGLGHQLAEAERTIRELEDRVLDLPRSSKKRKLVHGLKGE